MLIIVDDPPLSTIELPFSLSVEDAVPPNELEAGYFPTLGVSVSFLRQFLESLRRSSAVEVQQYHQQLLQEKEQKQLQIQEEKADREREEGERERERGEREGETEREGEELPQLYQHIASSGSRRAAIDELTTTDVCTQVVKPSTAKYKMSLCDVLYQSGEGKEQGVGEATVFISHAWKYKFVDVVDALETHFANSLDTFVWFDVFSVNQHSTAQKDFGWWSTTFQEAIRKFGRTVMVLSPWRDPVPFTRAWCLWELYSTVITGCNFEVAFSSRDRQEFFKEISVRSLNAMKATIDVSRSECFVLSDKQQIMSAIETQTTCSELNKKVFEELRNWMARVLETEVGNVSQCQDSYNEAKFASMKKLALLYKDQGRYEEALPLYKECFKISKMVLGDCHADTVASINSLASLYQKQGKYDEALPLFVECLRICKTILGENHPDTLGSQNSLAGLYFSQGKYDEALPLYVECSTMCKTVLGENHPDTVATRNCLAALYYSQGKYDEALPLYMECMHMRKTLLGSNHPDTLRTISGLALIFKSQAKYDDALPLYLESLEISKMVLGDNHPDTLTIINNLAVLYKIQGKYDKAFPLYQECMNKSKVVLGDNHPFTLTSINCLGGLYFSQGKYNEALPLLQECLKSRKAVLGDNHPSTLTSMNGLAALYYSQNKYDEAIPLFEECLQVRKRVLGENHPDTLQTISNLALLYKNQGKYDTALPLYLECVRISRALLGDNDPKTAFYLRGLNEVQGKIRNNRRCIIH